MTLHSLKRKPKEQTKKPRKRPPRFNLFIPLKEREELKELSQWYAAHLRLRITTAELIRMSYRELLRKQRSEIRRAADGKFHAKLRKFHETINR